MRRFLLKLFSNRKTWAIALFLTVISIAIPTLVLAQEQGVVSKVVEAITPDIFSLDNVSQTFISAIFFGISYLLSLIGGVIIALQGWFLEVILNISFGLVNSAPVRIGFPIVLSIANLFFVGALIVIAIATILRREEYGAKNVLWKLVVMAIMVNFGLVICGSLLSVSDEVTKFFIQSVAPGSTGDYKQNIFKFSDSIAGAFNPRAAFISMDDVVQNPALAKEDLSFFSAAGDNFGKTIKPIIGLFATLGSLVVIIITLATLNLMLLWRYIRLGIALIVLPLAWAAWIFPTYQQHYKKWWTKFTQWAIFPPVVVFFIWIGLKVSEVMSNQSGEYAPIWNPDRGDGLPNPLSDFLGALITPVISQTLKSFILFGIMMGGLVAAQELGVKFAEGGYKAVEGAGKGAKNWAMNRAKQAPGSLRQRVGGQKYDMANKGMGRLLNPLRKGANSLIGEPKKDAAGNLVGARAGAVAILSQFEKMQARLGLAPNKGQQAPKQNESMLRQDGETREAWEARVTKHDEKLERKHETSEQWQARVGLAAQADPAIKRRGNESMEAWKDRVVKRNPALADKSETEEQWEARVAEKEQENSKNYEETTKKWSEAERKQKWNNSLLGSVMGGVTSSLGHKKLKPEEVEKALGIHFEHEHKEGGGGAPAPHAPEPAGGGAGGHG